MDKMSHFVEGRTVFRVRDGVKMSHAKAWSVESSWQVPFGSLNELKFTEIPRRGQKESVPESDMVASASYIPSN